MVQKESQAALEERESERNANPAAASGASLEQSVAPAPGEDNPSGAGAAAVVGAAGGARRFLCGVVEGELAFQSRVGVQPPSPGGACW
jgi:protein O-GlcNAcase/histone acetyltransferase